MYKANVFIDGERQILLKFPICERLNTFFSYETQRKKRSNGKKETVSITTFKKWTITDDFRFETKGGEFLSA